ncbi:D-amino acid aminotransferase [bacterium]|nr:D-amino acid aminotransferase [bacterium]
MSRVAYAERRYQPHAEAVTPIEDRGLQFADGIYEVMEYFNLHILDAEEHMDRLERSLGEMHMPMPMSRKAMLHMLNELVRKNVRRHGLIYLQVNRGAGMRNHEIRPMKPIVIAHILPRRTPTAETYRQGIKVTTAPDIRWGRCDIKTVSLLGNILMKYEAAQQGAKDVFIFDEKNNLRESSSSNIFIVTDKGIIATPPRNHHILPGVTRIHVLKFAAELGIKVEERMISKEEVMNAKECFITSTSAHVLPVTSIDGKKISDGIGPVSKQLLNHYHHHILNITGEACPIL